MARPKSQWELEYLRRQQAINDWVRESYRPRLVAVEKLLVYHPDESRQYLRRSPCADCRACPCCDIPCGAYLEWYDRRLEAARVRCGMEDRRYEIQDTRYKIQDIPTLNDKLLFEELTVDN